MTSSTWLKAIPQGGPLFRGQATGAARGGGIGRALMRALAELALARGHKRLDWTADAANPDLLGFYEGLGAVAHRDKVFYRLTGEALSGLARTEA